MTGISGFNADGPIRALALPVFLVVIGLVTKAMLAPPEPLPANAPEHLFSAGRAMEHVRFIAREPHPMGTPAAARVRSYIAARLEALGLEVGIQHTEVIHDYGRFAGTRMATVDNIVAWRRGSNGDGPALMLMSHYDSRPQAPGAADAGAGVATILETLRALKHAPPLANDLLVVITDGEEMGLLGAQAFFGQHAAAGDVGVILNFEARGTRGRVQMFETSPGNAGLVAALAAAAPDPTANSMMYEVYRRMPNDTDLSIARARGLAGMNFAMVESFYDYHTMGDNADNLSPGSLQHMGNYALSLAKSLGNAKLPVAVHGNAVYFNTLGSHFVSYPAWVSWLVTAIALMLFAVVLHLALRHQLLGWKDFGKGFFALPALGLVVFAVIQGLYGAIGGNSGDAVQIRALFAQSGGQFTAYILVTFAIVVGGYGLIARGLGLSRTGVVVAAGLAILWFGGGLNPVTGGALATAAILLGLLLRKPLGPWALSLGALGFLALLVAVTQALLPTGSFLLAWPLIAILIAWLFAITRRRATHGDGPDLAIILVGASVGTLWLTQWVYLVYVALGVFAPAVPMIVATVLAAFVVPAAIATAAKWRGLIPGLTAAAGALLLVAMAWGGGFSDRYRQPTNLFYFHDQTSGENFWAAGQERLDLWTREVLGPNPRQSSFERILPDADSPLWLSPAPRAEVAAPELELVSETRSEAARVLRLRVRPGGRGDYLSLYWMPAKAIREVRLNGKTVEVPDGLGEFWRWRYYAMPAEGVEVELDLKADADLDVRAVEVNYQWPPSLGASLPSRPDNFMAMPYSYADGTVAMTRKTFVAGAGAAAR